MSTSIVVVGGGIAGLSFAISLLSKSSSSRYDVTVYEKFKDETACKGRYMHSLSIRNDLGGVEALQDLGIYNSVDAGKTPSNGAYIASSSSTAGFKVAVSTAWFDSSYHVHAMRVIRYDLWMNMLQRARELGINIHFDTVIENILLSGSEENGGDKHIVIGKIGGDQKFQTNADIVIVADGSRSVCRERLTGESTGFLGYTLVGAVMQVDDSFEFLKLTRHQHGLVIGHGHSLFLAEESDNTILVGMAFPAEREYSLHTDNELLRNKVAAAIPQFPDFRTLLLRFTEEGDIWKETFLVNCRDRYPIEWKGNPSIFFLGDSSHAVSPFAGAGANMALVDGNILGKLIGKMEMEDKEASMDEVQKQFQKETMTKWRAIVDRQRSTLQHCHSTSWMSTLVRGAVFTLLPFTFSPDYRVWRIIFAISLTVGSALTFARKKNLI